MARFTGLKTLTALVLAALLTAACTQKQSDDMAADDEEADSAEAQNVEIGQAIVEGWGCVYCHTPEVKGPDGLGMPDPDRLMSGHPGDQPIPPVPDAPIDSVEWTDYLEQLGSTAWPSDDSIVFSSNLTPDPETGIGEWTAEEFVETIRQGMQRAMGRQIKYPMPWEELSELSDIELASIYEYLMTLQPVPNEVPEPVAIGADNNQ